MKNFQRGFTLTEVLLVACLFAVISLAVFNAFSNGFKLWARGQHVMVEGDMSIFLDRISEDLRQTATISTIPFKGDSMQVSFPAVVMGPTDPNGSRGQESVGDQLGAIRYNFDPSEGKIYRSQATYGQALKAQWSSPIEEASQIEGITLRYYFKADRGLDVKSQTDQGIPLGVSIDLQFMIDGQVRHMRRFLLVPVGGGI